MKISAYLEIAMRINDENRPTAAKVYNDYRPPLLDAILDTLSKELLIHQEDIQVLHSFDNVGRAQVYLSSELFQNDVFVSLKPL